MRSLLRDSRWDGQPLTLSAPPSGLNSLIQPIERLATSPNEKTGSAGFLLERLALVAAAAVAAVAVANVRSLGGLETVCTVATWATAFFARPRQIHGDRASIDGHAV